MSRNPMMNRNIITASPTMSLQGAVDQQIEVNKLMLEKTLETNIPELEAKIIKIKIDMLAKEGFSREEAITILKK